VVLTRAYPTWSASASSAAVEVERRADQGLRDEACLGLLLGEYPPTQRVHVKSIKSSGVKEPRKL
jgi:hypothetical protein